MKKLITIIFTISLTVMLFGCGIDESESQTTPVSQTENTVQESISDPEPTENVVEETAQEPEPTEKPTPEPTPELTEEDIVAEALSSSEYQEDGAFFINRYIESLNYKFYDDEDFSIIIDGTEYYMWFEDDCSCLTIAYTDGERCFRADVVDNPENKRSDVMDLKVGNNVTSHSRRYVESVVSRLSRLASGDILFKEWKADGLSYGYFQYDSKPEYFDVGYIKASAFANKNEEESFIILYNQ